MIEEKVYKAAGSRDDSFLSRFKDRKKFGSWNKIIFLEEKQGYTHFDTLTSFDTGHWRVKCHKPDFVRQFVSLEKSHIWRERRVD